MERSYDLQTQKLSYGRRYYYILFALGILAILLFIAGGVMLGIGIHKYNQGEYFKDIW